MQITVEITAQRISDMFVGAIEGNHMTRAWVGGMEVTSQFESKTGLPEYADPLFFEQPDFAITVIHDGKDSDEGDNDVTTVIGPAEVKAGLELMASKYGWHFGRLLGEADDNITQDVFLQCIVLKDVVFG